MVIMAWFQCLVNRSEKRHGDAEKAAESVELQKAEFQLSVANVRVFGSKELVLATNKFNPGRFLGEGSSGRMYKGILEDGKEVAVKRFHEQEDLWVEAQMLSRVKHSSLVKMIGYCDKGEDHIIVYEYMPLRSLNLHLHDLQPGQKPLDWKTRMKIAEGVAKALEYLHNQNDPPILYGGLKSTGILLDENYNPKLSDFVYAKHGPTWNEPKGNCVVLKCPYGYAAPEYPMCGRLALGTDVYSFGVVLLELISGRKVRHEHLHIVAWAEPLLSVSKKFPEIADPLMKGQYPHRGLVQALGLAKMCLQFEAKKRPLVSEIVTTVSNLVSQDHAEKWGTTKAGPSTPTMHDA